MSEAMTLYKLIILYMLNKVDFPLTTAQLSEFILGHGYTNFFSFQQALHELEETDFIKVTSTHNRTMYHLTEDGFQSVEFFHGKLSDSIREEIDSYLKEKNFELKNESNVKTDFFPTNEGYMVRCQVIENNSPLIDLQLAVPTEVEAKSIADNWLVKNEEIYAYLMTKLL